MTTSTLTITDFLLARIAEDEALAQAASQQGGDEPDTSYWWATEVPGPTMRKTPDEETHTVIDSPGCLVTYEVCRESFARHIATHDPARVLAECEAKRRVVTIHSGEHECWCVDYGSLGSWYGTGCDTIRNLAAIYADHPDYREEWR